MPTSAKRVLVASPSRFQSRILDFVRFEEGNGVILATAGSGKTSTLVQVAASLPAHLRTCFLAFGRDAAAELSRRLPPAAATMTVHKLGRQVLQRALKRHGLALRLVERGKYRRLVRSELATLIRQPTEQPRVDAVSEDYLTRLSHLGRLSVTNVRDEGQLRELAERFNLVPPSDSESESRAHAILPAILERGVREAIQQGCADFTDMLYLPVMLGLEPPRYDFVCIDEAQDYSALALAFTLRLIDADRGGRLLFVGDPRQSVYGFAGADSSALETIVTAANATILPLSVSYRCPRRHVELARLLAPEIEAAPAAPEGRVFWIHELLLEEWAREGDLILCRANAPLVRTCLRLAGTGRRAFVLGRDLARQLAELARRAYPAGTVDGADRLASFAATEEARLRRALQGRKQEQAAVAQLHDSIECLRSLVESMSDGASADPSMLTGLINRLFGATDGAIVLSTVHRAKGKEADRVFILYPELMPAPYARTSEALRGEACVQFVALTRARRELVFVSDGGTMRAPGTERLRSSGEPLRPLEPFTDDHRQPPHGNAVGTLGDVSVSAPAASDTALADSHGNHVWREVLAHARFLAGQRR